MEDRVINLSFAATDEGYACSIDEKLFMNNKLMIYLYEKPLENYIGDVYYIDNSRLDINNERTTHHPVAIIDINKDTDISIKNFFTSTGTSSIPIYMRHQYYKCRLDKPTYFSRKTRLFMALEFVRDIKNKNIHPKWILDNRDLVGLRKFCMGKE